MQYFAALSLKAWFERLIPALFPLMILSNLCINKNLHRKASKIVYPIFKFFFPVNQNGMYAILTGFLFGFPMGAKVIGQLYQRNEISYHMAAYLLSFCNHLSPIFMITIVLPHLDIHSWSILYSLLLFYGVPLLYGSLYGNLIFKKRFKDEIIEFHPSMTENNSDIMEKSLTDAITSIVKLGGYMVFWGAVAGILQKMIHNVIIFNTIYPMLEITTGLFYSDVPVLQGMLYCTFGGLSCILQTKSVLHNSGLSMLHYVIHKLIQVIMIILFFLCLYP